MSGLVDSSGMPIGQVGKSMRPKTASKGIDPIAMQRLYDMVEQRMKSDDGYAAIEKRVTIQSRKVDAAISFWKPIYFGYSVEGRLLNGIEAFDLGDHKKTPGSECDKGPYIAMCNLMALEAIRMMGDATPTAESGLMLAYASDREKAISQFWKETFSPTEFQALWAWRAVLGVLAGNPGAANELLDNYRVQLP